MPKLFGTSGIRGPAEELFTNDFCRKLGLVLGNWFKSKGKSGSVAVAYDPRESSPRIKDQLIQGLSNAGWSILDQGVIPTPALTYFVKTDPKVAAGLMITGSHVMASHNGVKIFIDGEEVTKAHELEIENLFSNSKSSAKHSEPIIEYNNSAKEMYISLLKSIANSPYPNWKIALDTANGAQTQIMRELLPEFGLDVQCLGQCDIQSPYFAGKDTEKPSDYAELARQVLTSQTDFGIGFDVDGDRVILIDDRGNFIPGDYTCTLLAQDSDSTAIVTPISTSSVIDHIGKTVFRTQVGSTNVSAKMKEVGSTFGFEANGGAISAEIHFGRDAGTTLIKLLNLLAKKKQPLSGLVDSLPKYHIFRDKVDCPFLVYPKIYESALQKFSDKKIDKTDGVKIWLSNDEWLLFRGSGNAPEFRVFAESPDPNHASKLGQDGLSLVKSQIHPASTSRNSSVSDPADSLHILESIKAFPLQCRQVIQEISTQSIPADCSLAQNIVVSGMGGSVLGGRILASLERQILRIPIINSTEYHLPSFVNNKTLVIVSSYSGNTEETLSSLSEAREIGCQIFILGTGGQLAELASKFDLPSYIFDPTHNPSRQPRMGLGYNIVSLVALLSRCQFIAPPPLHQLPEFLLSKQSNFAKLDLLAQSLTGRIPVFIASEHLKGAAHALVNQFHENAKSFAVSFDLPEADHHLLEGLSFPKANPENLAFVFLTSSHYHPEVAKRYPATAQIVSRQHIPVHYLDVSSTHPFFEAMELVQAGAYLAFSLSQINGVDPGPIPWVDWMKDELHKMV